MEGLPGEAEELGPDYDQRSYVGERLMKLDLDTQSDVSRRTAAIIFIPGDSLHSLEDKNEGLIQPGHDGPDSRCLCRRVFCTYGSPLQGSWKKCRSTITVDTSLDIVPCQDNSALIPGVRCPPDARSGVMTGWHTASHNDLRR